MNYLLRFISLVAAFRVDGNNSILNLMFSWLRDYNSERTSGLGSPFAINMANRLILKKQNCVLTYCQNPFGFLFK